MESIIALIAYNEFHVIILVILLADLASHILKALIPLLGGDIGWLQAQIALAFLSPA